MKLQSVNIKNFRCFEDITIDFHERLTVLVGGNGSGKSATLDAINTFISTIIENTWNIQVDADDKMLNAKNKQYLKFMFFNSVDNFILDTERANSLNSKFYKQARCYSISYYRSLHNITPIYHTNGKYSHVPAFNATYKNSLKWFSDKEAEEAKHAIKIGDVTYRIPELQAVREAVSQVLGDYDFPFTAKVPVDMFICKKGQPEIEYSIAQLSNGYGVMLAFVIDLARQMAVANAEEYNKQGKSVLESPAIVLIDEVDLHLHPSWQQRVLPDLMRTFPNTQFIVTTHSPQVISSIASEHIRILKNGKVSLAEWGTLGAESSRVLEDVFGVPTRPEEIMLNNGSEMEKYDLDGNIERYFNLISEDKYDSDEAKAIRNKLEDFMPDDPMLVRADAQIDRARRLKERRARHA